MNPVNSLAQDYKQEDFLTAFAEVLVSGSYSEGSKISEFTDRLLGVLKHKHVAVMNSCGSALYTMYKHLASIGVKTVAVQNNTFYATGTMARMAGLNVVLVDSGPQCPSMGIDSLKEVHKLQKIEAVVLTHIGGMMARDYLKIADFCKEKNLILVEDCAHAFGLEDMGVSVGQLSFAACWSFYPTKNVPVGEGGALSTSDEALAEFACRFRNYGKKSANGRMFYSPEGMNLRMDELTAAVGCVQLKHLDAIKAARRRDAAKLQEIFPSLYLGRESNWYKYIVRASPGWKTVGKVYAWYDQLRVSCNGAMKVSSLKHSSTWADLHMCLPCGEGLYDGMSVEEVRKHLRIT